MYPNTVIIEVYYTINKFVWFYGVVRLSGPIIYSLSEYAAAAAATTRLSFSVAQMTRLTLALARQCTYIHTYINK